MKIYEWEELPAKEFDSIILGNGSSIAIDENFQYTSLFSKAQEIREIDGNLQKIFKHLKTEDFELVLRMLWHADKINKALNVKEEATSKAYQALRNSLIKTVQNIHVEYSIIKTKLHSIASFLKDFKTIINLNYDLIVYWAMMVGNKKLGTWFKDCIVDGSFREDWKNLREPSGAEGSSLVFYPHGNLILASDIFGQEQKIVRSNDSSNLMESIVKKWRTGDYSPIFVSEGTSDQKLQAINRSHYLKTVYDEVFRDLGKSIVLFGWSMSEQDNHILQAILKNPDLDTLAISVKKDSNNVEQKCRDIEGKIIKNGHDNIDITFFNAESDGLWLKHLAQDYQNGILI